MNPKLLLRLVRVSSVCSITTKYFCSLAEMMILVVMMMRVPRTWRGEATREGRVRPGVASAFSVRRRSRHALVQQFHLKKKNISINLRSVVYI